MHAHSHRPAVLVYAISIAYSNEFITHMIGIFFSFFTEFVFLLVRVRTLLKLADIYLFPYRHIESSN